MISATRRPRSRRYLRLCQAALDFLVASSAFVSAVWLTGAEFGWPLLFVLGVGAAKVVGAWGSGSYRQLWRFTSAREVVVGGLASALTSGLLVLVSLAGLLPFSLQLLAADFVLYSVGAIALRVLRRMAASLEDAEVVAPMPVNPKRTLVIGAGHTASNLILECQRKNSPLVIQGLLDDDPEKAGTEVHGVRVLGTTDQLGAMLDRTRAQTVIVAMPSAPDAKLERILAEARKRSLQVKVVDPYHRLATGIVNHGKSGFRLTDLLGTKELPNTVKENLDRDRDQRVLVTGGAGYIGSHLVELLLAHGLKVRVLDNFTYGSAGLKGLLGHPGLEVVDGDIANIKDVQRCVKNVGTVVALAAIVGDPACSVDPEETLNLNYESTKILVEMARFYGVKRFVFASSCSVYGASEDQLLNEDSPLNPVSLYARTRIMSENVLLEGRGNMEPVILRLSTVFGFSRRMRYDLVVNTLTVRGVVDGRFQIHGGQQWRPFVHCRDVARAFAAAVTASSEAVRPIVFNVGGEQMNYTLAQIGEIVKQQLPEATMEFSNNNDDPRNYRVSFARIKQHLGFEPEWTIEGGVKEMVREIRGDSKLSQYREPVYSNLASLQARVEPVDVAVPAPAHTNGQHKPAAPRAESAAASRKS